MKVLCVGCAGQIGRESVRDMVEFGDFERITIGDVDESASGKIVAEMADRRVDFVRFDITKKEESIEMMRRYDVVVGSLPIQFDELFVDAAVQAGVSGLDVTGMGKTYFEYDHQAREAGILFVPGVGMTPGTTNVLAKYAADQMDRVDEIYISHGAFRAIAPSAGLTSTTFLEYDPNLAGRVVYDNGQYVEVPPFSMEKMIDLPEPYGSLPQYVIPHPEVHTLPRYIQGVKRIEVRGTWPEKNMRLIKSLYEYGLLRNDTVRIQGVEIGARDFIAAYLSQAPEGKEQDLWGYALHVEVTGMRDGKEVRSILTTTHPPGDVKGWEGSRAYTRSVGIPLSIGTQMIAGGRVTGKGVIAPEGAFDPLEFIRELARREIRVRERIEESRIVA